MTEYIKGQRKRPLKASEVEERDDADMRWLSSGEGKGRGAPAEEGKGREKAEPLQEGNTFYSAFGARGAKFQLPSSEFLPGVLPEQHSLSVKDKDLKYLVLVLMQESLFAGMLQDWESLLAELDAKRALDLVQETLSILALLDRDLSQSELKALLKVKDRGLSEAWKRIWGALHESLGCTSKAVIPLAHTALRLSIERRYIHSAERRTQVQQRVADFVAQREGGAPPVPTDSEAGHDNWNKVRSFLSQSLAHLEELFVHESVQGNPTRLEEQRGVIKSSIIIARFLGDAGQFRDADILFDRARNLAIRDGNSHFRAEVSLYCAELLNKWSASDPAYSVDTMARSAEYAAEAAQQYEQIESEIRKAKTLEMPMQEREKYCQALYWKGLNYSTLARLGGNSRCSAELACATARDSLDSCLSHRKALMAVVEQPAKARLPPLAEVQFARGVLTFCMAESLLKGHLYNGSPPPSPPLVLSGHAASLTPY